MKERRRRNSRDSRSPSVTRAERSAGKVVWTSEVDDLGPKSFTSGASTLSSVVCSSSRKVAGPAHWQLGRPLAGAGAGAVRVHGEAAFKPSSRLMQSKAMLVLACVFVLAALGGGVLDSESVARSWRLAAGIY